MQQFYDTDVNKEYAIRGNSAVLKCQVPSFVADFVSVVSWHTDQGDSFYPSATDYGNSYVRHEPPDVTCVCITVVQQFYQTEVNNEYVIRGNSAVLKCSIPSFVADFVSVVSWQDDSGNMYAGTGASSNQGNGIPHPSCFQPQQGVPVLSVVCGVGQKKLARRKMYQDT